MLLAGTFDRASITPPPPRHDFGPGLARCSVCCRHPIFNRGCQKCQVRLCKSCSHICSLPKSNVVVAEAEGGSSNGAQLQLSAMDICNVSAMTACVHAIFVETEFIGLKVSCTTLGGGHVATFESSGDMQLSELKPCLCGYLGWLDLRFDGFDPDCDAMRADGFDPHRADVCLERRDGQFTVNREQQSLERASGEPYCHEIPGIDPRDPMAPWIRIQIREQSAAAMHPRGCDACAHEKALKEELGWDDDFLEEIGAPVLRQHTCWKRRFR